MDGGTQTRWSEAPTRPQDAGERSPDDLVEDIEHTRGAMTDTVEAIGDRLDPAHIIQDAKETVRESTVGKVEEMADTAGQMLGDAGATAQQAGTGIVETIRRNPVPAAMAALGIGWLATHPAETRRRRNMYTGTYGYRGRDRDWQQRGDWQETSTATSKGGAGEAISGLQETVSERASGLQDTVSERAGQVGETLQHMPDEMKGRAESLTQQAGRMLEESPLVVGAVAVAIGAVIGSLLPSTQVEQRVLGPATGKLIETAEQTATQAMAGMEQSTESKTGQTGQTRQAGQASQTGQTAQPGKPGNKTS